MILFQWFVIYLIVDLKVVNSNSILWSTALINPDRLEENASHGGRKVPVDIPIETPNV